MVNKVLLLDTSVATLNIGDEIILDSIRENFPELFENIISILYLPIHYIFPCYKNYCIVRK